MKALWEGKEELCNALLKSSTAKIVDSSVNIEEMDPGGAGVVSIRIGGDALQFGPNETAIKWLASNECADGAFIEYDNGTLRLHIVELKSKLDTQKWKKAKSQFKGMFLRATAIRSILGFEDFESVTCYIAYCEDAVTPRMQSNPILLKRTIGDGKDISNLDDWKTRTISMDNNVSAKVVDIVRDAAGNSTHNLAA